MEFKKKAFGGYDEDDVNEYVQGVEKRISDFQKDFDALKMENDRLTESGGAPDALVKRIKELETENAALRIENKDLKKQVSLNSEKDMGVPDFLRRSSDSDGYILDRIEDTEIKQENERLKKELQEKKSELLSAKEKFEELTQKFLALNTVERNQRVEYENLKKELEDAKAARSEEKYDMEAICSVLVEAKSTANSMIREAEAKAKSVVDSAEQSAQELLNKANERADMINRDSDEIIRKKWAEQCTSLFYGKSSMTVLLDNIKKATDELDTIRNGLSKVGSSLPSDIDQVINSFCV